MFKKNLDGMGYEEHLRINFAVVRKCFKINKFMPILGLFHLFHGLIPCRWTDHHYWNL